MRNELVTNGVAGEVSLRAVVKAGASAQPGQHPRFAVREPGPFVGT